MSKAQLVITAVVLEGRGKTEVARDYDVSRQWVHQLVAPTTPRVPQRSSPALGVRSTIRTRCPRRSKTRSCGCAKPWSSRLRRRRGHHQIWMRCVHVAAQFCSYRTRPATG
jgi:hypothetical protein